MGRYLITGSSGFVGCRLLKSLGASGYEIRLLSRKSNPNFETVICDFEKEEISLTALESVDTVFHLAGFTHDMRDASKVKHLYQKISIYYKP